MSRRPHRRDLLTAAVVLVVVGAALLPLSLVVDDAAWIRPVLTAAAAGWLVGVAARAARLPSAATLLLAVVGSLVLGSGLFLADAPLLVWLDELRALGDLAVRGTVAVREEASPAPPSPGLLLLLAGAAWWVSFVTHELAVRVGSAPLALVPPAALWVVPQAMPLAAGPALRLVLPFVVAAAVLLLVDADVDLPAVGERPRPRLTGAGAGVAAAAIGLGVVAPWLLPGLDDPPVLDVGTGRDARGYQPIVDVGDRLQLPTERAVMRVRTDRPTYLRLAALDSFDGQRWVLGPPGNGTFTPDADAVTPADGRLPPEVPLGATVTTTTHVEVLDLENTFVPAPYQPVAVSGPGADEMVWSTVGGFLATTDLTDNEIAGTLRPGVVEGFEYAVTAAVPDATAEQLRAADPLAEDRSVDRRWTALPGDAARWGDYGRVAEQVFEDAGATSTVDRVLALQRWFTQDDRFTYATSDIDDLRGTDGLETFLFNTRTGYCEYFATAMAVMLRATGIPARTAMGFLPGELVEPADPDADRPLSTYEVSTSDAHAWVEVLFPGQGWISFDPTPRTDGAGLTPTEGDLTPDTPVAERSDRDEAPDPDDQPAAADVPSPRPDIASVPDLTAPTTTGDAAGAAGDGTRTLPTPWLVVAVVLVAGAALLGVRRARSRRGGEPEVIRAQRRVLREAERLGHGRRPAETATEAMHRWSSEGRCDPGTAAHLAALAQRAAFSSADTRDDGVLADQLAARLVGQLRAGSSRRDRAVAPVRAPAAHAASTARDVARRLRRLVER